MKNLYKSALLAALGLGAVAAVSSAQAQTTYTGDVIIGFTGGTASLTANDGLLDFGSVASLTPNETFAAPTGFNLNTVEWGVVAANPQGGSPRYSYTSLAGAPAILSVAGWGQVNTPVKTIFNNAFSPSPAAGTVVYTPTSTGLDAQNNLVPNTAGWLYETVTGGTSTYKNVVGNPNSIGLGAETLYSIQDNGSAPVALGTFTLNANDTVTWDVTAVPEPTTYGFLAGAGVLALSLRNQFRRKQA
jgi:hypothetical protein